MPVAGFDPITQTWTITLASPLPAITHPVAIDGYSQANTAVSVRLSGPDHVGRPDFSIVRRPTGGSFTLTTSAPLPVGRARLKPSLTMRRPRRVQAALDAIVGADNVVVTGGPVDSGGVIITFQGATGKRRSPT